MRYLSNLVSILVGMVCIIISIMVFNSVNNDEKTLLGQLSYELDQNYRQQVMKKKIIGVSSGVLGGVFLIIGIIGMTRGRKRNEKTNNFKEVDHLQKQAFDFFNQEKYNEAIGVLMRLVDIDPGESLHHFNLACCYSELKDLKAFEHLSRAIAKGYSNFKKIQTYNALSWMRNHPQYNSFVQSGYKSITEETANNQ